MRRRVPLVLIALLAVASACGDDRDTNGEASAGADDDPWAEVETEFMTVCRAGPDVAAAAADRVEAYCRCVYGETIEFFGTVEAFRAAEPRLDGGVAAPDARLAPAFAGCSEQHLR